VGKRYPSVHVIPVEEGYVSWSVNTADRLSKHADLATSVSGPMNLFSVVLTAAENLTVNKQNTSVK
jgi:hypothetical protein